jgi:hypothetical protein
MADAADFRRIALSFEGAGEYPHFDRRAFKARVTFATLAPDELTANIKFAPDEQALKCAVAPTHSQRSATPGDGAAGPPRRSLRLASPNSARHWKWPGATRRRRRKRASGVDAG